MVSFILSLGAMIAVQAVNQPVTASTPDSTQVKACTFSPFIKDPVDGLMTNEDAIRAGLLYDLDRKVVVWEKDMNYAYPVASLTKMMVGLLAMEDIKSGKASWTDVVTVSREFYRGRKHKTRYSVQQKYTLEDLMRMAMVNSNNEATVWIGKQLAGGDLEPFIRRMNEKCTELGMEHTFYSNPSGLPAISGELDNSSSPNDLLILALELIKYQEMLDITSQPYITVKPGGKAVTYRNHNGMVIEYPKEVDGLKTGYTKNARFCLVATANRGGHRLISIVLGARSPYTRNLIVADMMNNYYQLLGLGKLGDMVTPDSLMARMISDSLNRNIGNNSTVLSQPDNDSSNQGVRKIYVKAKKQHTVRKGETLYSIADRYDCYAGEIKKWNRLRSSHLKAGQRLVIYQRVEKTVAINGNPTDYDTSSVAVSKEKPAATAKPAQKKTPVRPAADESLNEKFVYHIVQPGDTLWNIAQRYSGSVEKIKKANKIYNNKNLRPGTKLKIQVNS